MNKIKLTVIGFCVLLVVACSSMKSYPLDTCIVTDNELGSMGDVISYNHNGQEVKFCCKPCVKKFKQNPNKYLDKIN